MKTSDERWAEGPFAPIDPAVLPPPGGVPSTGTVAPAPSEPLPTAPGPAATNRKDSW